ncbi:tripartite tricarboxylate transporter substrate binding protein [Cupriavidus sp. CV2]|uniref:Bug family tripartite tricarboxylate transporter substrate binding protein n=1 Tax=Cupriavidus ulmosensis TaxID=3065913 RepID=UPI00296AB940|nr:tripartite tricarboxylate transporter substrate binding protein [Cupriavidus sp. CV2]MDW3685167.1 tripartite tricarboxylate transporter substrate binding protein [Cupriavidus sp. CV2]
MPSSIQRQTRRRAVAPLAIGATLLSAGTLATAAGSTDSPGAWRPDRPVTLVVPYSAGGGTDATARAVSKQLGVLWGQPVVVENLPGADGLIGTRRVMEAKPDGYTLLLQVPGIVVTRYTPGLKGIDPLARLDPITAISQSPAAVVASAKLPVKTLGEFVQYCKTVAKTCSLGTGESLARISGKQLAAEAGLPNLIIVNYRGTGAIVTDMIANNVNLAFTGITAALPHYKAGTLKILATQGHKRAAALPDVPTTAEAGYPQFQSVTWYGLFAPKGTPAAITQGVVAALREAVKDPEVQRTIAAAGAEPVVNSPAEFAAQVRQESERLGALVKQYPFE